MQMIVYFYFFMWTILHSKIRKAWSHWLR
jgi:hypothetical protein